MTSNVRDSTAWIISHLCWDYLSPFACSLLQSQLGHLLYVEVRKLFRFDRIYGPIAYGFSMPINVLTMRLGCHRVF